MNNFLEKNKYFKIIPEYIEEVTVMQLKDFDDNFLYLNNSLFDINLEENDSVEIYSEVQDGVLYAKSDVVTFEHDMLKLSMPLNFEILQRRKSERLVINSPINIVNEDNTNTEVTLQDLSVGGMKIMTNKQILLNKEYTVRLTFDNLNLNLNFIPLRLQTYGNEFIASGTLTAKNNSDKIELIQYCYNKKFEQENRK